MHLAQGILLSTIFQLAHLVEKSKIIYLNDDSKIEHSWAYHQLITTSNFGIKNKFLGYFLGGLNFQIEHHLFPQISHFHYSNISEIVKRATQEFNYPYNEYRGMKEALWSHYKHLKVLAK